MAERREPERMIPVSEPVLGEREVELVADAVRSGWISSAGPYLERFENEWARYCGRRHGVAVANGTVALQLAVAALGLGPGDEVILPSFTIISCCQAVIYAGATPVLVDVDPDTWCMDVEQVRSRITPRTRAVMPVHMYGHPVDMAPLIELCERHGLAIIEDAAEAHGAEYFDGAAWRRCGSFGAASVFSFYANKPITTGEGGMVVVDDDALADRLRRLRNLAFEPARRFLHHELGFNFRLTNLQAALGVAQLERFADVLKGKRAVGHAYREALREFDGLTLQSTREWARPIHWMVGVVVGEGTRLDAAELARRLLVQRIETRPFFLGMHEQPALLDRGLFRGERYPMTERLARGGLYLPSSASLSADEIDVVRDALAAALR